VGGWGFIFVTSVLLLSLFLSFSHDLGRVFLTNFFFYLAFLTAEVLVRYNIFVEEQDL
jgi:hypothetical protein